jgi:4-pyridoxate dehydrogenase
MVAAEFDTIIIGAGSAGSVLAGRLGEDQAKSILVLEAGGLDNHWMIRLPIGVAKVWNEPRFNWTYESEPEPFVDNRRIYHPRGKVVGGSSSINMMAYVRGNHRDFDRWRQKGLDGWSYADVLPYFKRAETWENGGSLYRGDSGPLRTQKGRSQDAIYAALVEAAPGLGYTLNDDFNAASQDGITRGQYTASHGRRYSAARAYLHPAIKRGNVTLETRAQVTALLFEGKRVVGVEYIQYGNRREARAREVILSGGSFNSPQLLLLSGIGPAAELAKLGIASRVDLPGVGKNLQDHPAIRLSYERKSPSHIPTQLRLDRLTLSVLQAVFFGTGFAATPPSGMTAFVKSAPEQDIPDLQLFVSNAAMIAHEWFPGWRPPAYDGFTLRACHLRQESRGAVTLASSDPTDKVRVLNNFLSTDADRRALRSAFKILRSIVASPPFAPIMAKELSPGIDVKTDAEIDAFIRQTMDTVYHPVGTCRMGKDENAVVGLDFRVRGVDGLRVVDASVFPDLTGGNINAVVMMVAEKASDVIRGRTPLPAEEAA